MKNILILSLFLISGCTVYTEKQSEAVSRSVYATKDSLDNARVDLAQQYIVQTTELIKPPKKRIQINAIYTDDDSATPVQVHSSKPNKTQRVIKYGDKPVIKPLDKNISNKKEILMLPESYKNYKAVYVNSEEYKKLLEDKKAHDQLKWDYYNLNEEKKVTEAEAVKQKQMNDQMVKDLNYYQKEVYKLRYQLIVRDIIIGVIAGFILLIVYLKLTKPIPFI